MRFQLPNWIWICAFLVILLLFPFIWRQFILHLYEEHIYPQDSAPDGNVAIVFGAAVYRSGRLSSILRDRLDTAIGLYEAGIVEKLLLSGDGSPASNFEPQAMRAYALSRGIPDDDLMIDENGTRTYNTCFQARRSFQIGRAILVTQGFHLPRALFTCEQLGIKVVGVAADQRTYRGAHWYEVRETLATLVALLDVARGKEPQFVALMTKT